MTDDRQGTLVPPRDEDPAADASQGAALTALRRYAMDLLARREHSRLELTEKLRRHCGRAQAARSADAPSPEKRRHSGRAQAAQSADAPNRHRSRTQVAQSADAPIPADPGTTEALIQRTLDQLEQDGLQSDARYAEMLIRSRFNRGQGPLRIRADLRQRGLDAAAVESLLEGYEDDWPDLALQVVSKRFGETPAGDRREWARRARFLAGRGFPEGLVARVLGPLP